MYNELIILRLLIQINLTYSVLLTFSTPHGIKDGSGVYWTVKTFLVVSYFSQIHVLLAIIRHVCFQFICCFTVTDNTGLNI